MDINDVCSNIERKSNEYPSQNSSNHILNSLNDDCIQEILRRLTNVRDFLRAAQVCTRFQSNAIQCFSLHFKSISIRDGEIFSDGIPVEQLTNFLSIFGRSIKSIRWYTTDRSLDGEIFKIIADSCGQTLLELMIIDHNINFVTQTQFEALEKLEIETSLISNFRVPSKLKVLKLKLVKILNFSSIAQKMQKLQEVEFVNVNGFTDEMLVEFLNCNPQLKIFKLEGCKRISSSVLRRIWKSLPNLISLHVMFFSQFFENADMLHIAKLRELKCLGINCPKFPAKLLFDLLIVNEIPLEALTISGYVDDLAENILKLKLLKRLHVGNVSKGILIAFVMELKNLEQIRIECNDINTIGIREALKYGRNLTMLTIVIGCQINIDLNTYNSILLLAKDRIRVMLMIRTGKGEGKKENFSLHREWVNVCYF